MKSPRNTYAHARGPAPTSHPPVPPSLVRQNYDVFDLRPGLWLHPAHRPKGYNKLWNLDDYIAASEYANSVTKLFGDSRGCATARKCDAQAAEEEKAMGRLGKTSSCVVANQCHAYRNATYMGAADVERAIRTLRTFKFVGLQVCMTHCTARAGG